MRMHVRLLLCWLVTACSVPAVTFTELQIVVSGTTTGLVGSGLILTSNLGDLEIAADGPFVFTGNVQRGTSYTVMVKQHPSRPTQLCQVTNGSGVAGEASVASVEVRCQTDAFRIGGSVEGLAGTGLQLQLSGGETVTVTADGSFEFPTPVMKGVSYDVRVVGQPTLPTQVCTVTRGEGTEVNVDIADVAVQCETRRFTIGGTVSGLVGDGVTLQLGGGETVTMRADGAFEFPTAVLSGEDYVVQVIDQPAQPTQRCEVRNGTGLVLGDNIANIEVVCEVRRFAIAGSVTGLRGGGLILRNGGEELSVLGDGPFSFPTSVSSGATYRVEVIGEPTQPTQRCTVARGEGSVVDADITNIAVTCATSVFTISGVVTGRGRPGLVLQNNGGDDLPVSGNVGFTFAIPVASGATYDVRVKTAPPRRVCTVLRGTGTVGAANVTNIEVSCVSDGTSVEFSENFVQDDPATAQCQAWTSFRSELDDPTFASVTISGSNDPVGVTCNDPVIATRLCQALHNGTSVGVTTCNGRGWSVGNCSVNQPEITADGTACACTATPTGYALRPCINHPDWGGVASPTCRAPSQNMTVTCE